MDDLLAKASNQVITFAVRSGMNIAGAYAMTTLARFYSRLPEKERANFERIKDRIQTKIQIISPAIDLIELIAARGNNSLVSTLQLTRELKADIEEFHEKMELAENEKSMKTAVAHVQSYTTDLLSRIEEAIPLINLALTTSGANLSSGLPDPVSPGRLLQAAKYLNVADEIYETKHEPVQVGPSFQLTVYSIYYATAHTDAGLGGGASIAWKEDYVKCDARLFRVKSDKNNRKFAYKLKLCESFDDGRYHDLEEEKPRSSEIDVAFVSRLFFSASGRLLEIEESNSPVLVLKVNKHYDKLLNRAVSKKGVIEEKSVDEFYREMDSHVEWLAFEAYQVKESDDEESDSDEESDDVSISSSTADQLANMTTAMENLSLQHSEASLSLLEYLIRLSALQENDQQSLYTIQDERIALYLKDESQHTNQASSTTTHATESPRSSPRSAPAGSYHHNTPPSGKRRTSGRLARSKAVSPGIPHTTPRTPLKKGSNDQTNENTPLTPWEQDKLMRSGLRNLVLRQAINASPQQNKKREKKAFKSTKEISKDE